VFSYLETVQSLVPATIYQRGIKYYMEGNVVGFENMILNYWREYKVVGSDVYLIKIPVLHLALDKQKFFQAAKALDEAVSCVCPYFLEYGVCKHVVAVCAALDNEFNINLQKAKTKILKKDSENVLDKIFEAEQTRNIREFEDNLELYLESNRTPSFEWLERFTYSVNSDPQAYKTFLGGLHRLVEKCIRDYDKEKKIAIMIPRTLLFGHKIWWDFWQKHIQQVSFERKVDIWAEIWEQRSLDLSNQFGKDIDLAVSEFDHELKQKILFKLQNKFQYNKKIWLNFALKSAYWNWFEENLLNLDPQTLIQVATDSNNENNN
jgi:hypothetical protein